MAEDQAQAVAFFDIMSDEQVETARQGEDARHRAALFAGAARRLVSGLDKPRSLEHARRQARNIAGDRFARRGGDEIEIGSRSLRAHFDALDEAADAALRILFGEAADVGLDGLRGLLVDQHLHIVADAAEHQPARRSPR